MHPLNAVPTDGRIRFGIGKTKTPGYVPTRTPERIRRDALFDAGLSTLENYAAKRPGTCFSQGEIARATGTTQQFISFVEKGALRKLRKLPRKDVHQFLQFIRSH